MIGSFLVILMTGAWQTTLQSTNMVTHTFSTGLNSSRGAYIVIASLILFAYTNILAWSYCGEKALEFLIGSTSNLWFRIAYIALIPTGTLLHVGMIWTLADIAITFMLVTNIIGVMVLSRQVITSSKAFALEN